MTRVLLVEDNRGDARLLAELLSEVPGRPFSLTHVETLADAIAAAPSHEVVLLDLSLPDASGLETVTRMLAACRALPIVVLTGNADDRVAFEAVATGAQDYLRKAEISPSLLSKTVRYAIERKKAEESARRLYALEVAHRKSEEAVERAQLVAAVAGAATASLDLEQCMGAVTALLVPRLADFCAVVLLDPAGALSHLTCSAGDPAAADSFRAVCAGRLGGAGGLVMRALAERRAQALGAAELAAAAAGDPVAQVAAASGATAALITPLAAGARALGAVLYWSGPERAAMTAEDRLLAEEIAAHVALCIENGRLFADAQRAIRARDELLAIVSHDLRNPLGVVRMALEMMERDPAALAGALPRAQRAADRMQRLIGDLLEVARIESGTLTVEPAATDLASLLQDLCEQHRVLAARKDLRLSLDLRAPPPTVQVDRDRITQALANVLGNALKFTPAGGAVEVVAEPAGDRAVISVSDTGPGIERDQLAHIFDRYWQSPDRRRDGVGLGLPIAKGIVEAHGGEIQVVSEPGRGTTFRILLPQPDLPLRRAAGA